MGLRAIRLESRAIQLRGERFKTDPVEGSNVEAGSSRM
jgi:hypothetical protein